MGQLFLQIGQYDFNIHFFLNLSQNCVVRGDPENIQNKIILCQTNVWLTWLLYGKCEN